MLDIILQYYLQIILTFTVTLLGGYYRRVRKTFRGVLEDNKLLKNGMLALLHERIMQKGTELLKQDIITLDDLQEFKQLYVPYREAGGNGTGKKMFEKIESKCILDMQRQKAH